MTTFRDIKRKARLDLHGRMAEPVVYVTDAGKPAESQTAISCRLHLAFKDVGELLRGGFAEAHEVTPTVVFLASQGTPARGSIVVTKDMGAWRIDNVLPPNDITINAEVVQLTQSQIEALGWDAGLQYMGLGIPEPISPVGPPELPIPKFNWTGDEW